MFLVGVTRPDGSVRACEAQGGGHTHIAGRTLLQEFATAEAAEGMLGGVDTVRRFRSLEEYARADLGPTHRYLFCEGKWVLRHNGQWRPVSSFLTD